MKAKIHVSVGFLATALLSIYLSLRALWNAVNVVMLIIIFVMVALYALYGFHKSRKLGVHILNDLPNALRLLLALLGGTMFHLPLTPQGCICGFTLYVLSLLLNDEYLRKIYRKVFPRGGLTIAFLGIDGSGKTTHAEDLIRWLKRAGYKSRLVIFSKYIFVDKLSLKIRSGRSSQSTSGYPLRKVGIFNILRLLLSLLDNLLYLLFSLIFKYRGYIVIYDRYIWSTFIKYEALRYPVSIIKKLVLTLRPDYCVLFDIPVDESIRRIRMRRNHIPYVKAVLMKERIEYLKLALKFKCIIVNTLTNNFDENQRYLRQILKSFLS